MATNRTNDQIILEQIVKERCSESDDELSISEYFEIYTASEILKNYDVSYDDIKYGIVGNGGDGGIDSVYLFINGELINEDTDINYHQKKTHLELILIQSKTSFTFKEDSVVKFKETAEDLFNLANNPEDYSARYNRDLIDKIKLFRTVYEKFARTFPTLNINYFYATQGSDLHPNVEGKVPKLIELIQGMFGGSECKFTFIGAKQLLEMTRNVPISSRILEVSETPISTVSKSYVCLVNLSKYYEFISDSGTLARSIFESNVRDYQGSVVVNTGIRQTLQNEKSDDFWYLNNGVTIITPKAVASGKQLTLEDPQIVNGLQTSHEIYKHFSEMDHLKEDKRAILVRIVNEADEEARDRIIRATNSQTAIPPASLRSSDLIHRNIEDFLKANGFYYDRKKNSYKNQGMPVSKIISIPYMAQAIMAIVLFKPDSARARPSTLINSEAEYKRIFSLDTPIDIYLKVLQIMKSVENYLRPNICEIELERKVVTNIKYYLAMVVAIRVFGNVQEKMVERLSETPSITIDNADLWSALKIVLYEYDELGGSDQAAKGSELISNLLKSLAS